MSAVYFYNIFAILGQRPKTAKHARFEWQQRVFHHTRHLSEVRSAYAARAEFKSCTPQNACDTTTTRALPYADGNAMAMGRM